MFSVVILTADVAMDDLIAARPLALSVKSELVVTASKQPPTGRLRVLWLHTAAAMSDVDG